MFVKFLCYNDIIFLFLIVCLKYLLMFLYGCDRCFDFNILFWFWISSFICLIGVVVVFDIVVDMFFIRKFVMNDVNVFLFVVGMNICVDIVLLFVKLMGQRVLNLFCLGIVLSLVVVVNGVLYLGVQLYMGWCGVSWDLRYEYLVILVIMFGYLGDFVIVNIVYFLFYYIYVIILLYFQYVFYDFKKI